MKTLTLTFPPIEAGAICRVYAADNTQVGEVVSDGSGVIVVSVSATYAEPFRVEVAQLDEVGALVLTPEAISVA